MPSKVVKEMADEEANVDLTPMIDVVFLLIIFFMCLKFKSYENKLNSELPEDQGLSRSQPQVIEQLRIDIGLVPGTFTKVTIHPKAGANANFVPIPWQDGAAGRIDMFRKLTEQIQQNFRFIGEKIEVAPQEQVPFEFVALTLDAIHNAQENIVEEDRKKITFKVGDPSGQLK